MSGLAKVSMVGAINSCISRGLRANLVSHPNYTKMFGRTRDTSSSLVMQFTTIPILSNFG